jgi:hypothetical protein
MGKRSGIAAALVAAASFLVLGVSTAGAKVPTSSGAIKSVEEFLAQVSLGPMGQPDPGPLGAGITECPHAGEPADKSPKPLDRRVPDKVEQLSNGGDDVKVNQDYSCLPQNETSIAVNPVTPKNVAAGSNDYRLGWGSSGFDSSTDNGNHWYDGIRAFPTPGGRFLPVGQIADDHMDGGGDPALVYDRAGIAYYADIHFERERDDNGVFVSRSTNGGFTWSRPCVPFTGNNPTDDQASCGGTGDVRRPGDGVVVVDKDPDGDGPISIAAFNDKEYIAAGPRPLDFSTPNPSDRVPAGCFAPETKTFIPAGSPACPNEIIGVDRLYVTWTRFDAVLLEARIFASRSDDQGRSWSAPVLVSGDASFCLPTSGPPRCTQNQFSVPTVNPSTGFLYVGYQSNNTPDENMYLVSRSFDGGVTFEGPNFATSVFDVNYPNAGGNRAGDCGPRGAQARNVLTNSCFRMISPGNIVVDKRGTANAATCTDSTQAGCGLADDLYMVLSDNRNGTPAKSNTDVFFFKSTDGGITWIGPTRVNDDPSQLTGDRDDPDNIQVQGNDNFYPWVDVSVKGDINVGFHDRRLDTTSTLSEWPLSRQFTGNYLAWFWGAICTVTTTATVTPADAGKTTSQLPAAAQQCLAPGAAAVFVDPNSVVPNFQNPGSGPVPGQGPAFLGPFKNFTLSDSPHNLDYSFRAGIFMGDYNNLAVGNDGTAYAFWTDSRNGRGSGGPNTAQPGRNPFCEQADVFMDSYSSNSGGTKKSPPSQDVIDAFSVTPCPTDMKAP